MKTKSMITMALAGLFGAFLISTAAVAAPQFTMKLTTTTANDADVEWLNTLKQGIDARSGGRIKVEVYPASQLGSAPRTIEGVTMGTVEVALNASGFYEGLDPRFGVLSATGIFDSMEQGNKVLNDPEIRKLLSTYGASKGYEVLSVFMHTPVAVVTTKPFKTLNDIQSKKIRVPGSPLFLHTFKALGAAPLSMSLGEVLPAMQNGTIDGAVGGNTIFTSLKFYDVTKSMTYLPSTHIAVVAIINSQFLKSIGPELSAIVKEEARKADEHIYKWAIEDSEKSRKLWEQNGGKSYALDGADAALFVKDAGASAEAVFSGNAKQQADYKVFKAVAEKYRKN
ncbi:TRAP-type C4-dicarboxylate transport system substrate-binding protein OS=Eoetvoesiella caeni OX=645616 GN=DFR37_106106 PE=3 SV=1 [Eoetvoesiella caeni]